MLSERDEFIYHEMIAHVPLFVHPRPERVLVIGGGDGGTAREVLRHPGVRACRMVEIDEMVVNACREHIPLTASSLDDPRLDLTIGDGVKFVEETDERFDVVLVDSTDPVGPAQPLFGEPFYRNVLRVLNPDGVVVSQGESPFYEAETQRSMLRILHTVFDHTHIYNFPNLTYPGGFWSFTFASRGLCPLDDFDLARVAASGIHFRYYTEGIHRAAFALPAFMKDEVQDYLSPHR
jgi:spermidine synthase